MIYVQLYNIFLITQAPLPHPQNSKGSPVVEKSRFLFANKSLFHLAIMAKTA